MKCECGCEKERNGEIAKAWNPDDYTEGYTEFWVCGCCGDVTEVEVPPQH